MEREGRRIEFESRSVKVGESSLKVGGKLRIEFRKVGGIPEQEFESRVAPRMRDNANAKTVHAPLSKSPCARADLIEIRGKFD